MFFAVMMSCWIASFSWAMESNFIISRILVLISKEICCPYKLPSWWWGTCISQVVGFSGPSVGLFPTLRRAGSVFWAMFMLMAYTPGGIGIVRGLISMFRVGKPILCPFCFPWTTFPE